MAKMGLSVKDDPRKIVDIAGREWGDPVDGLALSVMLRPKEDPDELPAISVAIQNRGTLILRLPTLGWLHFFQVSLNDSRGAAVELTPYGRERMKPERMQALSEIVLEPGEATEADIPLGSIYQMGRGQYRVQASCETPSGVRASSNTLTLTF